MLAAVPYTTFPEISVGSIRLHTFGLAVALGVLSGGWIAARWGQRFGIAREETFALAVRMVVIGVVGGRLTWAFAHLNQLSSPFEVLAVWNGGLQFSGGFLAALVAGIPVFRQMSDAKRWPMLDGYAMGLTFGLALGRIGCYSVGEHLGTLTTFPLAVRYDGGALVEPTIGGVLVKRGMTFHNTALYELLLLVLLYGALSSLRRNAVQRPGVIFAVFCIGYASMRFATDLVRANDRQFLGLTGAQYAMIVVALGGLVMLMMRRGRVLSSSIP